MHSRTWPEPDDLVTKVVIRTLAGEGGSDKGKGKGKAAASTDSADKIRGITAALP